MKNIKRTFTASLCTLAMMIFASVNIQAQDVQNQSNQNQENDVLEIIQSSDEHTIFASLLEQGNMVEELRESENVIVTAPTDEAFENMDEDINQLRQDPQKLEEFLSNHIENNDMDGAYADNPRQSAQQNRQQGQAQGDQEVRVITASNGEVHVVNKVKTDKNNDTENDDWDN